MEAFWEFCKELWRERRHTFGSREPRPKIDQQLHQGDLVAKINLSLGLIFPFLGLLRRLKQHVSDPRNPPILIFPEGTCINNTSVMQFKKGSFEVGGVIYPVAIK